MSVAAEYQPPLPHPRVDALKCIDLATRLFPFFVGLACLVMAERLWALNDLVNVQTWISWFWPWYAAAAGIATIAYGLFPRKVALLAISGAMVTALFVARALGAVFQLIETSNNISAPQLHIAAVMYTVGAVSCALIWTKVLHPSTHILKAHKTIVGGAAG